MFLDNNQLRELSNLLDAARSQATAELDPKATVEGDPLTPVLLAHAGLYCPQREAAPRHGYHGRNYLAIDPETKEVHCTLCHK